MKVQDIARIGVPNKGAKTNPQIGDKELNQYFYDLASFLLTVSVESKGIYKDVYEKQNNTTKR